MRYGSALYRPQATVPVLSVGSNTVKIGSAAYAEWRQVPVASSVKFSGATAWKIYDPEFALPPIQGTGDGTATVNTAGSYLMLFGAPNATTGVTLSAQ